MRLNMFTVQVPTLRERREDIPLLAEHFLHQHCNTMGKMISGIDNEAMSYLIGYSWNKGNARELSNAIERAVILCDGDHIQVDDLTYNLDISLRASSSLDLKTAVQQFERGHINVVLESVNGNREQAAEALGISVATLYRHLGKLEPTHPLRRTS